MSGIYSSVIVGIVVLVLGPYARFIPKSAIAGLLFITAARLIDWKRLAYAIRASRFDAILVFVYGLCSGLCKRRGFDPYRRCFFPPLVRSQGLKAWDSRTDRHARARGPGTSARRGAFAIAPDLRSGG